MHLLRGSWNVTEEEMPAHSPVRLLQKLAAYRATASPTSPTSLPSSPSPSPKGDRKVTILSESTNFFSRLWRPTTSQPTPSPVLIASHDTNSSSFDVVPEPSAVASEPSSLTVTPKLNRRISFIREVSPKTSPQMFPFTSPPLPLLPPPPPSPASAPPPLRPQPTTSSCITDPSFEDTTSEHPCDTASEIYSQSFDTNIDSSNPGIVDEQDDDDDSSRRHRLTYDERQRRLSLSTKSALLLAHQKASLPMEITAQDRSDSLASPEADIDVSMVSTSDHREAQRAVFSALVRLLVIDLTYREKSSFLEESQTMNRQSSASFLSHTRA